VRPQIARDLNYVISKKKIRGSKYQHPLHHHYFFPVESGIIASSIIHATAIILDGCALIWANLAIFRIPLNERRAVKARSS
jgi:hypothetical protein